MTQPHLPRFRSRREFLRLAGQGFGALAFAALLADEARATDRRDKPGGSPNPLLPKRPHFEARARSVIFLFMERGPSHLDLLDPKPELTRMNGKPLPARFGKVLTPMGTGGNALFASRHSFAKHGQSGLAFSDWLPHTATCADEFTHLRACWA